MRDTNVRRKNVPDAVPSVRQRASSAERLSSVRFIRGAKAKSVPRRMRFDDTAFRVEALSISQGCDARRQG